MTDSDDIPDDAIDEPPESVEPSAPVATTKAQRRAESLEIARGLLATPLPFLVPDVPGVGGLLKREPEDFVVEELPAYEPCGEGQHLFLWIEKRDVSADQLQRHLARTLGVDPHDVGMAGLKDRRAVTRQFVSVPAAGEPRLADVETDRIRVLSAKRHGNKLRTGHLRGNRFDILIRDVAPDALEHAQRIAAIVARDGAPNFFGSQRFGWDGSTLVTGLDLLRRARNVHELPPARRRFLIRIGLSAVQSALFNVALAERMTDGLLRTVLAGDVLQVVASGGPFVCREPEVDQRRFEAGEVVPTGPMFGPVMSQPEGIVQERERTLLARGGFTPEQMGQWKKQIAGTRRPYLVRPQDLDVTSEGPHLRFRLALPSGVYATTILREFRKTDDDGSDPDLEDA